MLYFDESHISFVCLVSVIKRMCPLSLAKALAAHSEADLLTFADLLLRFPKLLKAR